MQPIVIWGTGIAALIALLLARGGFREPIVPYSLAALLIALAVGFSFASRSAKKRNGPPPNHEPGPR